MLMDSLTNTLFNLQENMKLENKNMTILHYACIYGNTLILELLIQNGANLTGIDEDNLKAIDLATLLEKVKILKK